MKKEDKIDWIDLEEDLWENKELLQEHLEIRRKLF